ncbi:glycoside hydrolase family 3 C-terminal domain-containing protein [Frankia sp. CNm7]|uniref:Exo-alpha-(1->6)-L-arabinopyranosidase n=1 Tax=Frankia nepalensis TaxID=1836974 RepID=A0A937RGT0_9ACTN|nr:glycoside hydrolase family 3 C-terminal domain-containing protein [Frankia nepalensis]MBL7497366.1 glycoside hydrolase family 3 C-terminal domain-containing protein [Frankia nepalensis]MBL7510940.1 glycoside hydrolase family 3 C-terminal domain-containing protein [Frankia nepalensis]MBL7517258.1 glycoside hydrolase family 3 C-terminal domain-containing protein [Frankia nepalensis]MBL7631941.1 glycoside hydrolase family 3 C-terminal domain-containing protein [Frankia nepalensis]
MARVDIALLTLEQKASLLSGQDQQFTKALPEAGVAAMLLCDGPYGVRFLPPGEYEDLESWLDIARPATCFPAGAGVGNSWSPEVAAEIGAAVGREARAYGVTVNLAPAMNIKRSPLCGRNFEYYSEDPLLTGVLAAAYVRAVQSEGVGASVKHFAANNQETSRMEISAEVDERTLREIYLRAFELVVTQAQPATVMAAYNRVNGVWVSENSWLLRTVLRTEWGFTGLVVSDWGAVNDRVAALRAGLDLEMPGRGEAQQRVIVDAVRSGDLDEAMVDESVGRVLALTEFVTAAEGSFDVDAHHALARKVATECVVLLKNDNETLPLDDARRIAVIGTFASEPRYRGGGSSRVRPTRVDVSIDAIRAITMKRGQRVSFAPGFTLDGSGDEESLQAAAVTLARECDVSVVFAGLAEQDESEGFDRARLELPAAQVALIRAVATASPRTVVVLAHGGVVSLEGWHDDVEAILDGSLIGQGAGGALADLLFGIENPSGRLAETIPVRLQDNPSYLNFPGELGQVRYGEGVMVGYRYYETADVAVRYPFGHGLSYTTFETSDLTVTSIGVDTVEVSVTVANTGRRAGRHVVQIYVSSEAGPVRRPVRELRAFKKISLLPGAVETATFILDHRSFAYYDVREGDWVVAGGQYTIQVGDSAAEIVAEATVTLTGHATLSALTLNSTVGDWLRHPVAGPRLLEVLGARSPMGEADASVPDPTELSRAVGSMRIRDFANHPKVGIPPEVLSKVLG